MTGSTESTDHSPPSHDDGAPSVPDPPGPRGAHGHGGSDGDRRSRLDAFVANPRRALWSMAIPIVAGMGLHVLYTVVDSIFLGHVGEDVLASMAFVQPIVMVVIALTVGLGTGITAVVAMAIGQRDAKAADRTCSNAILMMVTISIAYAATGLLTGRWLLGEAVLNAPAAQLEYAWDYLFVMFIAAPLFFIGAAIRMILTGEGDAKSPMMFMGVGFLVNLALDPVFIFALDMGIQGAAVATVIAQGTAVLGYCYLFFVRRKTFSRFTLRGMIPHGPTLGRILGIGLPASGSQLIIAVGFGAVAWLVSPFGESTLAGYQAGRQIDMVVGLPMIGLAASSVTVIGMYRGAGRADLIRWTAGYVMRAALIIAVTIGTLAYISAPWMMRAFLPEDSAAVAVSQQYLAFAIGIYPCMAIGMTAGRILQGVGRAKAALVITFVRVLGVAVPAAYVAVHVMGTPVEGVWGSILASALVATLIAALWVRWAIYVRDPSIKAEAMAEATPDRSPAAAVPATPAAVKGA